ncbi:MAG TPA: ADP-ribosylglycohydrolase family protein, partial [Euryarchaeota archaeon]|nr:ADP-ribosylglycohydrolase family protein [Euryarchaeota archaeon]
MKNKFIGALLGFVVGDVLGSPFEGIGAPDIKEQYGYIKGPVKANAYTDDTIMMKIVLDTILEEGRYDPKSVLKKYLENKDKLTGIGLTTYYALSNATLDDIYAGAKYAASLGYGFGNGPLMRAPPIALYHFYSRDVEKFVEDVVSETLLTHHTNRAVTATVMFSKFLNSIGEGLSPEDSYL